MISAFRLCFLCGKEAIQTWVLTSKVEVIPSKVLRTPSRHDRRFEISVSQLTIDHMSQCSLLMYRPLSLIVTSHSKTSNRISTYYEYL